MNNIESKNETSNPATADPVTQFRNTWLCFDYAADPVAEALDQIGREIRIIQELIEEKAKTGDGWVDDLSMSLLVASQKLDAVETFSRREYDRRANQELAERTTRAAPVAAPTSPSGKPRVQDEELASAASILKDAIKKIRDATIVVDDCHRDEGCSDTDALEGALTALAGARFDAGVVLDNIDMAIARLNGEAGAAS